MVADRQALGTALGTCPGFHLKGKEYNVKKWRRFNFTFSEKTPISGKNGHVLENFRTLACEKKSAQILVWS